MTTARTVVVVILDIIMVALPNLCVIKLLMVCSISFYWSFWRGKLEWSSYGGLQYCAFERVLNENFIPHPNWLKGCDRDSFPSLNPEVKPQLREAGNFLKVGMH